MPVSTNVFPASFPAGRARALRSRHLYAGHRAGAAIIARSILLERRARPQRQPPARVPSLRWSSFLSCAGDCIHVAEILGENLRRLGADEADAEPVEQPRETAPLRAFDVTQQVLDALRSGARNPREFVRTEPIDVRDVAHEAELGELLRHDVAQTFDVHCAARCKVAHAFVDLGGARGIGAARHRLVLGVVYVGAADWAAVRHRKAPLFAGSLAGHRPDHSRNDVAGARDQNDIADADIVALDVVDVMERGALHRDAADLHRFENGIWVEGSGASDADDDIAQLRTCLARLEFERDRPTRVAGDHAEPFLQGEVIHLDDDAVDLVIELVATRFPPSTEGEHVVERFSARDIRIDGKAERFEPPQRLPLRPNAFVGDQLVGEKREPALRGQRGIELADAAGRRVSRVGEERQPFASRAALSRAKSLLRR